jgi:LTXXQ motif family protein
MKPFKSQAGLTFAAVALSALLLAAPAAAQPGSGPRGWGPGMMMGPGMMGPGMMMGPAMCGPRAAGLAEWRFELIERAVRPTEAQRPALNELKAASTKAAEVIAAACPREFPETAAARLEFTEKRLEAMLQGVKIVRPAFDAFEASLTSEQKAALNRIGPRRWGWRGWRWRQS